jgi:type VI secretion system protein ImpG
MAHEAGVTPLITDILTHGHEFSFVQVMRLARKHLDTRRVDGHPIVPWQDRVGIRPELSLAFPASDVVRVEQHGDHLRVTATFLELYGPASPLPNFFTEELFDEASHDESVLRDFIDILHQRSYQLYFRCWSKYRLLIRVVEEQNPIDRERLLCLIGLGQNELASSVPEAYALLRYTGILSQYPRSATGLATMLRDALKLKNIRIKQNVKRMVSISSDQQMRMGMFGCRLGMDTVLGSRIADRMGRFRMEIGPLAWDAFNSFLPGTGLHEKLSGYTRFYLVDPLDVELKLILAAGEAKPIRIGDPNAKLGINTWSFAGDTLGEVSAGYQLSPQPFTSPAPLQDTGPRHTERGFIDYYRRERARLGELAARFTDIHPNLAPMINGPLSDPGVERLLEGTAFLNALLQQRLDDDFPEIIHELTESLHPWDLRPIPATTIVAFTPKDGVRHSQRIPQGAEIASIPVKGTRCTFRTCFDVTVHPLTLLNASYSQPPGKSPRITLQFELNGLGLSSWKPGFLRFFLADDYPAACDLYLLLMRYLTRIQVTSQDNGATMEIPCDCLKPVGFAQDEILLTKDKSLMQGHLILQEFFLFRDKFLFFDLTGLEPCAELGNGSRFEIRFELTACPLIVPEISEKSFVLAATQAINLFRHQAKPVSFVSRLSRHLVQPTGEPSAHFRIYSVDKVTGLSKRNQFRIEYDVKNPLHHRSNDAPLCYVSQNASLVGNGFDTLISIPSREDENKTSRIKLDITLTCTNGILPEHLDIGDVCIPTSTIPESVKVANWTAVTAAIFQDGQQNHQWKLLSGFSLNSISLHSAENLRSILRLFIHSNCRNQGSIMDSIRKTDALVSIDAIPADRLMGRGIYRGYDVRLKFRGDGFAGPGDLYLFCVVLERFLGGYVTQNCFMRLVVEEIGKGYRFEWPARMGDRRVV